MRKLDVALTYEQFIACPNLLAVEAIENTFPTEGSEEWTAMRLTVDDVLLPLLAPRPYVAFVSDRVLFHVRVAPRSLLIREPVRHMLNGIERKLPAPYRVSYADLAVGFELWALEYPFPRFPGAARVRFEAATVAP